MKLFQSTCHEAGVINWVGLQFWNARPQKMGGQKIVKNSARFLTSFDFDREYLRNGRIHISKIGKVAYQLPPIPRWVRKKLAYFGP